MRNGSLALFTCLALAACNDPAPAAPMDDAGYDLGLDDAAVVRPDVGPDAWMPVDAGAIRMTPTFPTASGTCPDLTHPGMVTVSPSGIAARPVQIWVSDAAAAMDGPFVFVWHGAGGSPSDATYILGDALAAIVDQGGIVVAPTHDPANVQLPWYLDTTSREDDLFVADEILACAHDSIGFDPLRVHSVGFSAGALHTAQMSFRRASYLASVVTYSGGLVNPHPPMRDAPDARFAAMALYGGADDVVIVSFQTASQNYLRAMEAAGDFGFLCNHGMGHTVPAAARASAWAFLDAHRYGQLPRAYASGLPADFYSYCALP
jgi:predicted esterase